MKSKKINVGIFFGGVSVEHEVSRRSALYIVNYLDKNRYDFTLVEITKKRKFYLYDAENESEENMRAFVLNAGNRANKKEIEISEKIFKENNIDVVFPVLHGTNGEDGIFQGFLEMCGQPYVGSGVRSSAIGFDKAAAKILFEHKGIPQADYMCFDSDDINSGTVKLCEKIDDRFDYPVFVKPSKGGSSVGIYKVMGKDELANTLKSAALFGRKVLVEKGIKGKELECAVIGGYKNAYALGVGEITPCNEFYDYEAKYINEESEILIPASISSAAEKTIMKFAVEAFNAIDAYGLARVDFFLTEKGEVILNEINTMPGFTNISMYPKLWRATGKTDTDLITMLVELALERKERYSFLTNYIKETTDE